MKIKIVICIILVIATVTVADAIEVVTFKGTGTTLNGDPLMLTGKLTKPQGNGPFPALVCLHGCGGISKRDHAWVERLSNWGYVALQLDSFGPRGKSSICKNTKLVPHEIRAQDAHDAKAYLLELPFVNKERIAVMGWSHGGATTLQTVNPKTPIKNKGTPFRAAIAFYPYCDFPLSGLDAPLLILIGDYDDWTPARMCYLMMPSKQTSPEVILKIYPKAYHGFDGEGMDRYIEGAQTTHRLLYNPEATADAIVQVKGFLERHLK